jgi:hypothetical protein
MTPADDFIRVITRGDLSAFEKVSSIIKAAWLVGAMLINAEMRKWLMWDGKVFLRSLRARGWAPGWRKQGLAAEC